MSHYWSTVFLPKSLILEWFIFFKRLFLLVFLPSAGFDLVPHRNERFCELLRHKHKLFVCGETWLNVEETLLFLWEFTHLLKNFRHHGLAVTAPFIRLVTFAHRLKSPVECQALKIFDIRQSSTKPIVKPVLRLLLYDDQEKHNVHRLNVLFQFGIVNTSPKQPKLNSLKSLLFVFVGLGFN